MITFEKTDLDEDDNERSARLGVGPFKVDIAYQLSDAGGWAIVILIDIWDDVIATASRPVAAGLTDAELVELAREPLAAACADAAATLDQARIAVDRIVPLFSS